MIHCPDTSTLQDFLEQLLPEPEQAATAKHVAGCARCAAERVRLEHLFDCLDALPMEAPSAAMAERVLDRVLPSRRQARWVRRLGLGYAGALAASLAAGVVIVTHPAGNGFQAWVAGSASASVFNVLKFLVNATSFVALRLASGWGLVSYFESKTSPMLRALFAAMDVPAIQMCLVLSAVTCIGGLLGRRS